MNKGVKTAIIAAAILIAAGCILGVASASRFKWNFQSPIISGTDHSQQLRVEYSGIRVDLGDWDVEVYRVPGDEIELSWREPQGRTLEIDRSGDVLTLREVRGTGRVSWATRFWSTGNYRVSLGLPEAFEGDLEISQGASDVTLSGVSLSRVQVDSGTGDIRVRDMAVAKSVRLETSTGSVSTQGLSCGELTVSASTGDVKIADTAVSGALRASASTGGITLSRCAAAEIAASCTTGDIRFSGLDFKTGVSFTCSTGDVQGTLPGSMVDYTITADTGTGESSLPPVLNGGPWTLNVRTGTGDIEIEFEK